MKPYSINVRSALLTSLFTAASSLSLTAQEEGPSLHEALLAYWAFEDSFSEDHGGFSISPRGEDPILFDEGKFGRGIVFNGIDQYLEVETESEDLFDFDPSESFTISAWIQANEIDSVHRNTIIEKGDGNFSLSASVNGETGGPEIRATPGNYPLRSDNDSLVNAFQHVVLVVDSQFENSPVVRPGRPVEPEPPGKVFLYVDGVQSDATQLSRPGSDVIRHNTTAPVTIGASLFPSTTFRYPWSGMIDDVAIWRRALSEDEIHQIYREGEGSAISELLTKDLARIGGISADREGVTFRFRNGQDSAVDSESFHLVVNGDSVPATFGVGIDDVVEFTYHPAEGFTPGSQPSYTFVVRDTLGNELSDSGAFSIPELPFLFVPRHGVNAPSGRPGFWGLREIWSAGSVGPQIAVGRAGSTTIPESFAFADSHHSVLKFGDQGPFGPNGSNPPSPIPTLSSGFPVESVVIAAKATIEHPGGDLTLGVHAEGGFGIRVRGQAFSRVLGTGFIDPNAQDIMVSLGIEEDSDARGIIEDLPEGVYELEVVAWQAAHEVNLEVYSAFGAFENDEDTGTWRLLGEEGGLQLVSSDGNEGAFLDRIQVTLESISLDLVDTGTSMVEPSSIALMIDGVEVPLAITKEDHRTTLTYTPNRAFDPGSVHTVDLTFRDHEEREFVESRTISVPEAPFPLRNLRFNEGSAGNWGLRLLRDVGEIRDLKAAVSAVLLTDEPGFEGQITDWRASVVNHRERDFTDPDFISDTGLFANDVLLEGATVDAPDNDYVILAHAYVVVPSTGDWTIGVRSDDGFALRFKGHPFSQVFGKGVVDETFPEFMLFAGLTPDSNSHGVLEQVEAGVYEIEFVAFESLGDSYFEIYAAPGVYVSADETDTWDLIGSALGWALTGRVSGAGVQIISLEVTRLNADPVVDLTFKSQTLRTYSIFRSSDLVEFEEIADDVTGLENSTFFRDLAPFPGAAYYIVKEAR